MRHTTPLRVFLLLLPVVLSGCISNKIARAFTDAPNGGRAAVTPNLPIPPLYDAVATLDTPGPPPITVAYWIKEPTTGHPPRATVLLLHGWNSQVRSSDLLHPVTQALADTGCRVILPDLRGHGDSTGEYVTSGYREVQDLQALLTHLDTRGQLDGPVGVVGHSYGGGIAIQFAARDSRPQRALVFSPLTDIRPAMLHGAAGAYHLFFQFLITPKAIANAQRKMQQHTGADLAVHNALHQ